MKHFLISLLIIGGIFFICKDQIVIPKEAIRLRIIANSDSEYDQNIKNKVKDNIEVELYNLMKDEHNLSTAKEKIELNLNNVDDNIKNTLKSTNYPHQFSINFGKNYFPQKNYKGITYKEGYYDSLVVTLGEGKGKNWWCVMFPPFCLLEAQNENTSNVEYKWLVKELIDKYF